jgi:hypothetical protein
MASAALQLLGAPEAMLRFAPLVISGMPAHLPAGTIRPLSP